MACEKNVMILRAYDQSSKYQATYSFQEQVACAFTIILSENRSRS